MIEITTVPAEYVHLVWPTAGPMLERALARAPGRYAGGDIYELLVKGGSTLWLVFDDAGIIAACATRLYDIPLGRILCVEWLGGGRLREWVGHLVPLLERYAKDLSCTKIEAHGRKGWKRILEEHGWRQFSVSYEKDL